MRKSNQNSSKSFLIIKITLFIGLIILAVWKFEATFEEKSFSINIVAPVFLVFSFLLVPLNYYFEWLKWREVLSEQKTDFGIKTNFQAFMAGIITGVLTPNMQGNFLGRMYYYPRKHRISIIILTLWTNLAQFLISLIFGLFSVLLIGDLSGLIGDYSILLISLLFLFFLIYFLFGQFQFDQPKWRWWKRLQNTMKRKGLFKLKILFFGTARYLVFALQFFLVLLAFGAEPITSTYLSIFQLYFWTTIAPSLILGKLVVRESIAVWLMGGLVLDEWSLILTSFLVWFINLFIPTIIGFVVCKRRELLV